jgi:SAM-dependent methyltransferase
MKRNPHHGEITDVAQITVPQPAGSLPAGSSPLSDFTRKHFHERSYTWAMDNYKSTLLAISSAYSCSSWLEIGGGRWPLFTEAEVRDLGITYTVNDISEAELQLCPKWADRVCFDIGGTEVPCRKYDLVFSRMVMEHVRHADAAYRNVFALLRRGGITLNFHPTLYAPPFVLNYLLPTQWSQEILSALGRHVTDAQEQYPKFPARYQWCRSTRRIVERIRAVGFDEVVIVPFYGHGYFQRIPVVGPIDRRFSLWAQKRDYRIFASYAYTIARR